MNKEKIKEFMPFMQAMLKGKTIQHTDLDTGEWVDVEEIYCGEDVLNYRIKPESKYRPFKNAEECLKEMSKHTPFGWLKGINRDIWTQISYVRNEGIETVNSGSASYESLFDCFIFFDGKPFGVKVEE